MAADPPQPDPYLVELVRGWDRPRYVATLFAPAVARPALFALYAFAAEVARVPGQVNEAGLGEIRLQWWREAVEALAGGAAGETPVLRALGAAMAAHGLPAAPLTDFVEAHRDDLYADPPASRAELEFSLGRSESALFQLAAVVLGSAGQETADAAGHSGIAYGVARRLARLPADRARGRVPVPADYLWEHGISTDAVRQPAADAGLAAAAAAVVPLAEHHLAEAVRHLRVISREQRAAFLPLAMARPLLARLRRAGAELVNRPVDLPRLAIVARITAAALLWPRGI
ncbi:MAG TPA: squalene/phytoene synthase family protein [Afifellaceae bacterium]|nr:squalene/phytoene synthase family protein [Afifellaceae bacterium]